MMISGMEVQTSTLLVDNFQYRFPRSKRKRINKKWYKNKLNWKTVPSKELLHFRQGNVLMCHPSLLPVIEKAAQREQEELRRLDYNVEFNLPFGFSYSKRDGVLTLHGV